MHRLCIMILAVVVSACGRNDEPAQPAQADGQPSEQAPAGAPAEQPGQPPEGATVKLAPTQGNTATGTLTLVDSQGGVRITGTLRGLKPDAQFAFHIHEKGDCSAPDASSAGGHFNPTNQPHGNPQSTARHAGDMANLQSDAQGVAQVDTTVPGITVHAGESVDVLGKAIVVHEKADDYTTQPSGASGSRIACGVITVQGSSSEAAPPGP